MDYLHKETVEHTLQLAAIWDDSHDAHCDCNELDVCDKVRSL